MCKQDYLQNPEFHKWCIRDRERAINEMKAEIQVSTKFLFEINKKKIEVKNDKIKRIKRHGLVKSERNTL